MNKNTHTETVEMEDDILSVLAAWRAYGRDNAQQVFSNICREKKLKKFEQVMLSDKIIKRL